MSNEIDGHLLNDVLIEILSRLSVKSLLRCKSVCKYWYSLIRNPSFISKHYHHYNNRTRLLVNHYLHNTGTLALALFPEETLASDCDLDYIPVHEDLDYIQPVACSMVGPLNGIFFLYDRREPFHPRMALWNLATREFRTLPVPTSNRQHYPLNNICPYEHSFGFGQDPLTNDYKIVLIHRLYDRETDDHVPAFVAVYTQANDSWRHLDPLVLNKRMLNDSFTTYVNGAYYWLLSDSDEGEDVDEDEHHNNYTIILFDMRSDAFREIPGPDNPQQKLGSLFLHNESIAMFLYESQVVETIDVWIMKQEGCWTKHFTLGPLPEIRCPLGFWKNDQLFLITNTRQLVLYNPNTHKISYLGTRGKVPFSGAWGLLVFGYKESLVSVKRGNEDLEGDNLSYTIQDFFTLNQPNS